jgi:hypothetical protein
LALIEAYDDARMVGDPVYRGVDGFARMLAAPTEGFEDVRYEADQFTDAGDCGWSWPVAPGRA